MNEAKKKGKITNLYVRTLFLSYLIEGAEWTKPDGYPIIEKSFGILKPLDLAYFNKPFFLV